MDKNIISKLENDLRKEFIPEIHKEIEDLKFKNQCLDLDVKVQKARRRHMIEAIQVIRRSIGVLDKDDIANMLDQIVETFDFK